MDCFIPQVVSLLDPIEDTSTILASLCTADDVEHLVYTKEACSGHRCRQCGSKDHLAAECGAPKTCSLCGSEEHLYRRCPSRKGTYASLFLEDFGAISDPCDKEQEDRGPDTEEPGPASVDDVVGNSEAEPTGGLAQGALTPEGEAGDFTLLEVATSGETEDCPLEEAMPASTVSLEVPPLETTLDHAPWTPMSWAEAVLEPEAVPSQPQPDWATLGPLEDQVARGLKRSRLEVGQEFEPCALDGMKLGRIAENEDIQKLKEELLPTHCNRGYGRPPQNEGTTEEEGWTQVLSRQVKSALRDQEKHGVD